jgi:hypothetical protein
MNTLFNTFKNHQGRKFNKFRHYPAIYERYFSRYVGTDVTFLELGVQRGGSLQVWKEYFGDKATILGVDIKEKTYFEEDQIKVFIGSQDDTSFLEDICKNYSLDIVVDDCSHFAKQTTISFETLFPKLKSDGIYLVEDLYASYRRRCQNYKQPFVEFTQDLVHGVIRHNGEIGSMHYHPGIVVFEKSKPLRKRVLFGKS